MPEQPRSDRKTQNRVIALFTHPASAGSLGYHYLVESDKREHSRPIETALLQAKLEERSYSDVHVSAALRKLETAADATGRTRLVPRGHTAVEEVTA